MSESVFQFTDRYQAAGIPYPDSATVCQGQCEGMGCVPISRDEADPRFKALWDADHAKAHRFSERVKHAWACDFLPIHSRLALLWEKCDGWHFVKCPDCNGTRKRS